MDLISYTNTYYCFPSDGYVYILLNYEADQYLYVNIGGAGTSTSFPLHISTGGNGHFGNTSQAIFVRKGMFLKIDRCSDISKATVKFLPLS